MRAIASDPDVAALQGQDRAVYEFATKIASDAACVEQKDVDALRAAGLSDAEVADVVFAAAARWFFTRVLDGLGAQTAAGFDPEIRASMIVGRPAAAG